MMLVLASFASATINWSSDVDMFIPLQNTTGSENGLADLAENHNDCTAHNGAEFDSNQSSFVFDRTNYIKTNYSLPTNVEDFTMSIWVNANDLTPGDTEDYVNSWVTGTESKWVSLSTVDISGGSFRFTVDAGGSGFKYAEKSTSSYSDWVMVTGVRDTDNARVRIYVNGVEESSNDITGYTGIMNLSNQLVLGQRADITHDEAFGGKLSDFIIFNRALNSTEISELYNEGRNYNPYLNSTPETPSAETCSADINEDGTVDDDDFYIVSVGVVYTRELTQTGLLGDINNDNAVNATDARIVLDNWGEDTSTC